MTKTTFKITRNAKLPEGVKLAKSNRKLKESKTEMLPLTKLSVGDAFFAPGYTTREISGSIHTKRGTRKGTKFRSFTVETANKFGTMVYRVK